VEVLNYLKRTLGIILRHIEESGVAVAPFNEHTFKPELEVTDVQTGVDIGGLIYSIKADKDYAPAKMNMDRPITSSEYTVVWPGTIKVVMRKADRLYLQAPLGQTSKVSIEALRVA
jgi:hypothetical protein